MRMPARHGLGRRALRNLALRHAQVLRREARYRVLAEEKTDETLSKIAIATVNAEAA